MKFRFLSESSNTPQLGREINALLKQLTKASRKLSRANLLGSIRTAHVLVAWEQTRVIGIAVLAPVYTPEWRFGLIEDLVVDEKKRGLGIGKQLIMRLVKKAQLLKLDHLQLTSNPSRDAAIKLYESLGFKKRETNVFRLQLSSPAPTT